MGCDEMAQGNLCKVGAQLERHFECQTESGGWTGRRPISDSGVASSRLAGRPSDFCVGSELVSAGRLLFGRTGERRKCRPANGRLNFFFFFFFLSLVGQAEMRRQPAGESRSHVRRARASRHSGSGAARAGSMTQVGSGETGAHLAGR